MIECVIQDFYLFIFSSKNQMLIYLQPVDAAQSGCSLSSWRRRRQHAPLRNDDVDILMINPCLVELGRVCLDTFFIDSF